MNFFQCLVVATILTSGILATPDLHPANLVVFGTPPKAYEKEGVDGDQSGIFYYASGQGASRFQQVYSSDYFTKLLPEGGRLKYIQFRSDLFNETLGSGNKPGFEVSFSTTTAIQDNLDPAFQTNVGNDSTTVVRRDQNFPLYIPTGPTENKQTGWNVLVTFTNGEFFYDPRKGNLLLDIISENTPPNYEARLDAYDDKSDGISSVYAHSVHGIPTSGKLSSLGFVTSFYFEPVPEPSAIGLGVLGMVVLVAAANRKRVI